MAATLEDLDLRLLDLLQVELPLVERPFAQLAQRVNADEADVLSRVRDLKHRPRPVIRQISAIFDSKALGYQSTLVAARIPEDRLDEAAAVINRHPGVSHNYRRDHAFNLWYTLALPPDSRLGLEGTVQLLHRLSGAEATRLMPTLKLFKIGVRLDLTGEGEAGAPGRSSGFTQEQQDRALAFAVTDTDRWMIRVLQQDLPIEPRPFDGWAEQAGVSVAELLAAAASYQQQGRMRRFSAVLRHREAGFSANAMGVWAVPLDRQEEFGRTAAGFAAVSHCYLRPTYPDWPYAVFTMIHARDRAGCEDVLSAIARATGVTQYTALYSTREYKKTRVRYFADDIDAWEETHCAHAAADEASDRGPPAATVA